MKEEKKKMGKKRGRRKNGVQRDLGTGRSLGSYKYEQAKTEVASSFIDPAKSLFQAAFQAAASHVVVIFRSNV